MVSIIGLNICCIISINTVLFTIYRLEKVHEIKNETHKLGLSAIYHSIMIFPKVPTSIIAKLPESGDTSDDITECDVWKDLAEAEG